MSQNLPPEVINRLIAAMDDMRGIWHEIRGIVPQVGIVNNSFAASGASGPALEVVHSAFDGKVVAQHEIPPGDELILSSLEPVSRSYVKVDVENPADTDTQSTLLPRDLAPPRFGVDKKTSASVVQIRLAHGSPHGASSFVTATNLTWDDLLHAFLIVPDVEDLHDDLTILSGDVVGHKADQTFLLTQTLDEAASQQILLYLVPHGVVGLEIGSQLVMPTIG